ncbi:TPA: hypothetical protein ACFBV3_001075 [Neisseria gonorrhoeae]
MPDRIKPSRNGGGADGRETRNIPDREARGFFAPVAGGDWI